MIETRNRRAETSSRHHAIAQPIERKGLVLSWVGLATQSFSQGQRAAIVPAESAAAPKLMRYLPFWAAALAEGRR